MFKSDFVASILLNGNIAKEEGTGEVKIPFGSEYGIRLRNKNKFPAACDIYIDGRLVNSQGSLFLAGNQFVDIDHFITKDGEKRSFEFVKIADNKHKDDIEENETQNGNVEVRFYKSAPVEEKVVVHEYIDRPIYIYREWYPWWQQRDPWYPYRRQIIWGEGGWSSGTDEIPMLGEDVSGTQAISTIDNNDTFNIDNKNISSVGYCSVSHEVNINGKKEAYHSEGATINGRPVYRNEIATTEMRTVKDPIVLMIKLEGYKPAIDTSIVVCKECGEKIKKNSNFCPECGEKRG